MFQFDKVDRHAGLIGRMAGVLQVDLGKAIVDGRLPAEQYRTAVMRCTACSNPDGCERWLAENWGGADAEPGYCRNTDFFRALADE